MRGTNAPSNETSVPFAYRCALRNRLFVRLNRSFVRDALRAKAGDSYTYRQASSKKDGRNRKGVNPLRQDLLGAFREAGLPLKTIEELREVSAELGLELSPEKEAAFMAVRIAEGELTEQQLDATVGGAYHVVSPSDVCDFQASETKCCATCKYGQFDWPNYYCVVTL